ncbi:MAG: VOC family virulence protein, partial [Polynucleobacter sp. 24-46-87]
DDFIAHLSKQGVPIDVGPVPRRGALGPIRSVYLRDPDQNLVEVAEYV